MTAGAAVDDKRADERRIKELRDFQRSSPTNKRCFDCNEMMPQYVCVDFNTFVCTSCSGLHREFGHRVKSISMSKFTETEVKNILKFGGNEAAQKIWRAKHDASFRPSGGTDGERTRNFIRLTYVDKKWQYESPRASDQPQSLAQAQSRTGSGGANANGKTNAKKAAPSFDAFSDPSPPSSSTSNNNSTGGFAAFGDFASFETSTKSPIEFEAFGRCDSPSSASSQSTSGFGDFGGFASKPSAAPPLRDEFKTGSFTLAPPPGSAFGAFTAPPPLPSAVATLSAQSTSTGSGGNDFLAFSPVHSKPPTATNDPFGFANSPVAASAKTTSHTTTPFDAFGSPVSTSASRSSFDTFAAPTSTGSRSGSAVAFDAFGATTPSTPASSAFDAFGSAATPTAPSSPGFGGFGTSTSMPAFDAFGGFAASSSSQAAASPAAAFDAFGSAPSPAGSGLGGFGTASSSSRTNSATPADPFAGFGGARTSSGTKASEPPADPFNAFDAVESTGFGSAPAPPPSAPAGSAYDAFGGVQHPPTQQVGQAPSPFGQVTQGHTHPLASADPFAFAGVAGTGASSKTGSFPNAAPNSQSGFGNPSAFGASPQGQQPTAFGHPSAQPHGFPPQQQQQFQQHQQMHQQQGQFGQFPTPGFGAQPGMPPQQQQWMQSNAGAFGGQFPPQQSHLHPPAPGAHAPHSQAPPTAPTPPKADVAALKDPFASLSMGSFGLSSSASAPKSNASSRSGSFVKPAGSAPTSTTSSFSNAAPLSGPTPSAFGAPGGFGVGGAAPPSSGGSRGNSFEMAPSHFGSTMGSSTPSPMASFSAPAMGMTPSPTPAFGASTSSPMGSFAFPGAQNTPQTQHNSFGGADAFDAFGSSTHTHSMKQPAPPAASSNPFDMF